MSAGTGAVPGASIARRRPICGVIAILLPGVLVAVEIAAFVPIIGGTETAGYRWLFVTMIVLAATPILCGAAVVLGIAALVRRERLKWLAIVGLAVNSVLVVKTIPALLRVLRALL